MARTRAPKSKNSLNHYGLEPEEDKQLIVLLRKEETSASALVRKLLRNWMKVQQKSL